MIPKILEEVFGIESLVFGKIEPSARIFVYLHGAGEFGKGCEGQYQYPGFARLLRDDEILLNQPFVIACCLKGEYWSPEDLKSYLSELTKYFGKSEIDLIGYSRGGLGVYEYLHYGGQVKTATVINSRVPNNWSMCHDIPMHIIHAVEDQNTSIDSVLKFTESLKSRFSMTVFDGDHFSIEAIAKSQKWLRCID